MKLNRNRIALFTTAILCIGLTICAHANLLINSSFEDSIPMFGWTRFGAGAAPEISTTEAQDEVQVIKIFQDFSGADNWNGIYQDVPVQGNTKYRLAGYVRNGTPDAQDTLQDGNIAFMKVEWFDKDDNLISSKELNTDGRGLTSASEAGKWVLNDITETSPANASKARIVLLHQYLGTQHNGGSSWFDNVNFEQVP